MSLVRISPLEIVQIFQLEIVQMSLLSLSQTDDDDAEAKLLRTDKATNCPSSGEATTLKVVDFRTFRVVNFRTFRVVF